MTRAIAALGGVIAESLVDENGAAPGLKATPGLVFVPGSSACRLAATLRRRASGFAAYARRIRW